MTDTTQSPVQTAHKAWWAAIAAAAVPIVLQNLSGASDSFSVIYDAIACNAFGTVCPTPEAIADSVKSVMSAIGGGVATGFVTYFVSNRAK